MTPERAAKWRELETKHVRLLCDNAGVSHGPLRRAARDVALRWRLARFSRPPTQFVTATDARSRRVAPALVRMTRSGRDAGGAQVPARA